MDGILFVTSLGIMVVTAALLVLPLQRLHIPAIVSYVLAGIVAGPVLAWALPFFGGEVSHSRGGIPETVELIGEVGIALLLFIVGLELRLDKMRSVGSAVLSTGLGQVLLTTAGGFAVAHWIGFSLTDALALALALSFSSTVVVIKLLDQKKELDSLHGRISVGILLVQDLVVIALLTVLAGLEAASSSGPELLGRAILLAALGVAILFLMSFLAARFLVQMFGWAARNPELVLMWSLGWCFLYVMLAETVGLSPELGAFMAGISLASLPSSPDLRRRIRPLANFFLAVFFISLGAQMELQASLENWLVAACLSLLTLLVKPLLFLFLLSRRGYGARTSFLSSTALAQISEFSLIVVAVAAEAGLVTESVLSLVGLIALFTMAASSYLILHGEALYHGLQKRGLLQLFDFPAEETLAPAHTHQDHIVLVGLNTMGRQIAQALAQMGETLVVIDRDSRKLQQAPGAKVLGSIEYPSVAQEAELAKAKLGISTLKIEDANNTFAFQCHQLGVPVAIHGFDISILRELEELGVDFIIDAKACSVDEILKEIRKAERPGA